MFNIKSIYINRFDVAPAIKSNALVPTIFKPAPKDVLVINCSFETNVTLMLH
jgi:hypothetical protein